MSGSTDILSGMVRKLEIRTPLTGADKAALLALPFTPRTLNAHSYTVREGDPPLGCAVLLSGYAVRHKLTADGARQIVGIHVPGDALDLQHLFLNVSDHNVQTLTRADVAVIERGPLHKLACERPAIMRAILVDALAEASIFREWLLNVGRRDSRSRIAHLLCEFAKRLEAAGLAEGDVYELPMNQEQLADAVGLTPVHVNRTLKSLEGEGLIERDRRRMFIRNWRGLGDVADFSDRYLHLESQAGDAR